MKPNKVWNIILTVIIVGTIFIAPMVQAPKVQMMNFRRAHGNLETWAATVQTAEYQEKVDGYKAELTEENIPFVSDAIIEIADGLYINGVRGVTGQYTIVQTFGRSGKEDFYLHEDGTPKRVMRFSGAENSPFPEKEAGIYCDQVKYSGHVGVNIIASPDKIWDGKIMLEIRFGEDENAVTTAEIPIDFPA